MYCCYRLFFRGGGGSTVGSARCGGWRGLAQLRRPPTHTRMHIRQLHARTPCPPPLQIKFRLARSGFMRDFAGSWTVQPFSQDALDLLLNQHHRPQKCVCVGGGRGSVGKVCV